MHDIITFGSATQDVFMSSRELKVVESEKFVTKKGLCVPMGSKMHMESVFFAMGGCGTNAAVTFAKQGLKTVYFGRVGKDAGGEGVKDVLSKNNVSLELLQETDKWATAYSLILSLPGIGRSILEYLGASHRIAQKDIPFENLKAEWFYVGPLSGPSFEITGPVINFAYENKIKIAANPGRTQLSKGLETFRSLLNKLDILILNQEEAAKLTGLDFEKEKEIFEKLDKWVEGIVVMTKGPNGVVVSDGKNLYSAGIPESGLVDRTGAGDSFSSGFVSGWIEKTKAEKPQTEAIEHAIQLGTANATTCLQKLGAANGLLEKGEWGPWPKVEVRISGI